MTSLSKIILAAALAATSALAIPQTPAQATTYPKHADNRNNDERRNPYHRHVRHRDPDRKYFKYDNDRNKGKHKGEIKKPR